MEIAALKYSVVLFTTFPSAFGQKFTFYREKYLHMLTHVVNFMSVKGCTTCSVAAKFPKQVCPFENLSIIACVYMGKNIFMN